MAAPSRWRSLLDKQPIFDKLREHIAKIKIPKECRCITAIRDGELIIWDEYCCVLLITNLKQLLKPETDTLPVQTLLCSKLPSTQVDSLILNSTGSLLALVGPSGASIVELPEKVWLKSDNKDVLYCKTISVDPRLFLDRKNLRILHAAWHPGSRTDSHLVLLTSDNAIRIYMPSEPDKPDQYIPLSDVRRISGTVSSISAALGEQAVCFDFAPPATLSPRSEACLSQEVWPMYLLWGSGDVYYLLTSLDPIRSLSSRLCGPLSVCPAAEDNYGLEACYIICIPSQPLVLCIATCAGHLYHCIVLDQTESVDESPNWFGMESCGDFEPLPVPSLFVYENVELELSLATVASETEDFSYPFRLHKDPACLGRYHCSHSAGVHSILLPWLRKLESFFQEADEGHSFSEPAVVEHVICTRPIPTMPLAPVLGLCVTSDALLGSALICLTSNFHCLAIPLLSSIGPDPSNLLRPSDMPAHKSSQVADSFEQHIISILQRDTSHPIIRSNPDSSLSPQECLELLSRATQVFREQYIQKQELVQEEIERRARALYELKVYQQAELARCQQSRNKLTEHSHTLAERYEDAIYRQKIIFNRLDNVLRRLRSCLPLISEAEDKMRVDLDDMQSELERRQGALRQLELKLDFLKLEQQEASAVSSQVTATLSQSQTTSLRKIMQDQGDQIANLMKKMNQLKSSV